MFSKRRDKRTNDFSIAVFEIHTVTAGSMTAVHELLYKYCLTCYESNC